LPLPPLNHKIASMSEPIRESLLGVLPPELDELLTGWGLSKFRGRQVRQWVFEKLVIDPAGMSNLSRLDRDRIAAGFSIADGQILREQHSTDGTIKLLIGWADGAVAETVMIPDNVRRTACISSQVGCPVGCRFCASGIGGVKGNLTAARIVEQVLHINRVMKPNGERINHVVFMGMGEPLANYANVIRAIRILNHPECFNIGARKITVSTVGVPAKMRHLADEDLSLNLAISLHAPNEPLRRQLIPWAEHFDLAEILNAGRYYFDRTGRELTLEYVLLGGVNDSVALARELSRVCKTIRANVNLIRYNPVEGLEYKRPTAEATMAFVTELREHGVNAHVRKSRGSDIDAACGQLRRRQEPAAAPPAIPPQVVDEHQRDRSGGFTIIELLVAAAAMLIVLAIFIPYLEKFRESARRTACAQHLEVLGNALRKYAQDNGFNYPRVRYDALANPNGYAAFTGAWSDNAFATGTSVAASDVTASLWLLLKSGYIKDPGLFICPGSENWADPMTDAHGRASSLAHRANFQAANNLSYSYATPFSNAFNYRLNSDHLPADFALMSDKNPGFATSGSAVIGPARNAPPLDMAGANSFNHQRAGQNVLFAAGNVNFQPNPYCGVAGDNIFTALAPQRLNGEHPALDAVGYIGPAIGPAYEFDSYLVPTAADAAP